MPEWFTDWIERPDRRLACPCGREHILPPLELRVEEELLVRIPEILSDLTREGERIFIVCDVNTYAAAGERLACACQNEGLRIEVINLGEGDGEPIVPDKERVFSILEQYDGEGYLVACGAGTINDLTRFVSSRIGRSYTVVPTAPSMDGYTSAVASITVGGVKKTYPAVMPEAVLCDLDVIRSSPWELIQSGFCDLLGKATSLLDWQLGRILFSEYHCPRAADLIGGELAGILAEAERLEERSRASLRTLIQGLIYSGIAMQMVGSSRPASGGEHHISHFLDMCGLLHGRSVPPHGIKVGLGTWFTSRFYLRLLERHLPAGELSAPDKSERAARIRKGYASRADAVLANLEERFAREKTGAARFREKREEVCSLVEKNRERLTRIPRLLSAVGVVEREDVRRLERDWLERAVKYGFEIRARYTITTLLYQLGYLDAWGTELVDEFYECMLSG